MRCTRTAHTRVTPLRANPSPEVTDLACRLPLPTCVMVHRGGKPLRPAADMGTASTLLQTQKMMVFLCVGAQQYVLPQRLFKGLGQRYSTLWRKYLARRQYPYATWSAYKIPALSGRVDISPIARPRQSVGRDPIQGPLVVQGPGSSQGTKFPIPFRHKRGEGLRVLTTISSSSSSVSVPLCVTLHNTTRIIATLYH